MWNMRDRIAAICKRFWQELFGAEPPEPLPPKEARRRAIASLDRQVTAWLLAAGTMRVLEWILVAIYGSVLVLILFGIGFGWRLHLEMVLGWAVMRLGASWGYHVAVQLQLKRAKLRHGIKQ